MRRKFYTLITLLCLCVLFFNTAYAGKTIVARKARRAIRDSVGTDCVSGDNILDFAMSLLGTRYRPKCSNPFDGFDCSGFVSYVFKKFNFNVPRSSCEFAAVGERIRFEDAKPGDIILFTGTKKHTRQIGHIGIVVCNSGDDFKFIHSTSGKEYAVTITTMDATYRRRFVEVIRLLKQNDEPVLANTAPPLTFPKNL
jgi:hypothetical protein